MWVVYELTRDNPAKLLKTYTYKREKIAEKKATSILISGNRAYIEEREPVGETNYWYHSFALIKSMSVSEAITVVNNNKTLIERSIYPAKIEKVEEVPTGEYDTFRFFVAYEPIVDCREGKKNDG